MGWYDYYRLIEQYGSVDAAPKPMREAAAKANPNTPSDARKLAEYIWARDHAPIQRSTIITESDTEDLP